MEAVHRKLRVHAARLLLALGVLLSAGALAACGDDGGDRTQVRPPVTRNVSIVIGDEDITASPDKLGAGPLTLLVSNQSGAARTLSIEGSRVTRTIGPIQPQDTATVKVTVEPGELELAAVDTAGVQPATLIVGPKRPTAQDQLQLP